MKSEIAAAASFLSRVFLEEGNHGDAEMSAFQQQISQGLEERFTDHWHPSCPTKGQVKSNTSLLTKSS